MRPMRPMRRPLQVNLPGGDYYRISGRTADADLLSQLLCVAGDNNPSLGGSYAGAAHQRFAEGRRGEGAPRAAPA